MTVTRFIRSHLAALLVVCVAVGCDLGPADHPLLDSVLAERKDEVQRLLSEGADPNKGNDDFTPLMGAAEVGNVDLIELLIGAGADPHKTTEDGESPLTILATNNDNMAAAERLILAGVNPCIMPKVPERAKIALDLARDAGHEAVAQFLATKSADCR